MKSTKLRYEEQGFATLVVSVTLVVVLSLLTVGFAHLMRNEQDQATNRQLSNQAYYAAEAGINDALRALSEGYNQQKSSCGPLTSLTGAPGEQYLTDNNVDAATAAGDKAPVQWTCLLIDPTPSSLEYSPVDTVTPTVFTAKAVQSGTTTPASISKVTIAWKDADSVASPQFWTQSGISDNQAFPQAPSWTAIGMVRVSITPLVSPLSRGNITKQTVTAFLYPTKSTAHTSMTADITNSSQNQQGELLDGACDPAQTYYCKATINFSPSLPAGTPLLITLRSIYGKTHVFLSADTGSDLQGAQAVVDSTGRAQDVLKRIQVRVPSNSHYDLPGFVLDSVNGICKQLSVYPNFADGCTY